MNAQMYKARCFQQIQWKYCNSQKLKMAEQSSIENVATISKLAEYDTSFPSNKVRSYYLRVVKQVWFVDSFAIWNASNENNAVNYAGTG